MKHTLIAILTVAAMSLSAFGQGSTIKTVSVYAVAGVPSSGTSEIDTLTIAASTDGGTFKLAVEGGRTTQAIAWSATNATLVANVDAALEALPNIGTGGVTTATATMTSGIGTITITFTGRNAKRNMPLLSIASNAITGGATPTITTTTPGVEATYRDALPGTLLVDTITPDLYINDGTSQVNGPTWTKVSP